MMKTLILLLMTKDTCIQRGYSENRHQLLLKSKENILVSIGKGTQVPSSATYQCKGVVLPEPSSNYQHDGYVSSISPMKTNQWGTPDQRQMSDQHQVTLLSGRRSQGAKALKHKCNPDKEAVIIYKCGQLD